MGGEADARLKVRYGFRDGRICGCSENSAYLLALKCSCSSVRLLDGEELRVMNQFTASEEDGMVNCDRATACTYEAMACIEV